MRCQTGRVRQMVSRRLHAPHHLLRVVEIQSAFGVHARHPFMRYIISADRLVRDEIAVHDRRAYIVKCVVTGPSNQSPPSGEIVAYWSYRGIAITGYIVSRGKDIDGTLSMLGSTTSPNGGNIEC